MAVALQHSFNICIVISPVGAGVVGARVVGAGVVGAGVVGASVTGAADWVESGRKNGDKKFGSADEVW